MAFVVRAFAVLLSMPSASGQYSCPSGYAANSGWCARATDESCSAATCCKLTGTLCSATNVLTGDAKCKAGSDKNVFWDLKKGASVVPSGGNDDDLRAACCTSCSDAKCADWQTVKVLTGCGSGKMILGTNSLASADCSIPADDKYKEACCVDTPATPAAPTGPFCSGTGVVAGNTKCKTGSDKNVFFDLKKAAQKVGDSDDSFRSTCCTSCSQATCADWQTVKFAVGCGSGKFINPEIALSSADCSIPDDAQYKATCCQEPKKCADYSAAGDSSVSGAFPKASSLVGTFVASFMVLVGAHHL